MLQTGGGDDAATGLRLGSVGCLLLGERLSNAAVATCTIQPNNAAAWVYN